MNSNSTDKAIWHTMAPRKRRNIERPDPIVSARRLCINDLLRLSTNVAVPQYKIESTQAGIVHFGVGNFHRAHLATYLDDLFNLGLDQDWAIIGAGVREQDANTRDVLFRQDFLSTIVEREADSTKVRVVGSMSDFLPVADPQRTIKKLIDPDIRIVSLTVTEGGYFIEPSTHVFDERHVDVVNDVNNPDSPRTVFGLILQALRLRHKAGLHPFTVLSCDNILGNGDVTRSVLLAMARQDPQDFLAWLNNHLACPNSMVDRITPATTDQQREFLAINFNIDDPAVVFCESFRQWVVEDHFPAGRPMLDKVGVQFVDDVSPFELAKIRLLNGGHATIAYAAALLGIQHVHEAMTIPVLSDFLREVQLAAVIPTLPRRDDIDLFDYAASTRRRFANPKIADTITRLCHDGSNRQPKFIIPTIRDILAKGQSAKSLALVCSLWARYCYGEDESGKQIRPNDVNWKELQVRAKEARYAPRVWLDMTGVYGELGEHQVFADNFSDALMSIWSCGVLQTLRQFNAENYSKSTSHQNEEL